MKPAAQALHMKPGEGDLSYAKNSTLQRKAIFMAKPVRDEAITKLYLSKLPRKLCIADLGCSSGPNTLLVTSQLVEKLDEICKQLGNKLPECQVFLNDLPENDFNTVFKSLPEFQENLVKCLGLDARQCFFSGVPGSFHGKLFPSRSLDFIHSSYSIHWLSQIPQGVEGNKGNICAGTTSPSYVVKAYQQQFQRDFSTFLKFRSEELKEGGRMVLIFLGRSDDPLSKGSTCIFEVLGMALSEMALKGLIDEAKADSFNIPLYSPSLNEVKSEVLKEGSFSINRIETFELHWNPDESSNGISENEEQGRIVAKHMRAGMEPLLVSHFGEEIIDEMFNICSEISTDKMSKENTTHFNLTVSLTKVGQ